MKKYLLAFVIALVGVSALSAAAAHEFAKGDLSIAHPWAGVTHSPAAPAAVYFDIVNHGAAGDRLLSASADIAQAVEIHESARNENGVVRMRPLPEGLAIAPGATVSFATGAYHVMLIGLAAPLAEGASFPMHLVFEKAGEVEVTVKVENRIAAGHDHHQ